VGVNILPNDGHKEPKHEVYTWTVVSELIIWRENILGYSFFCLSKEHVSPVSAVRLVVLHVNRVWALNVMLSRNSASMALNVITAAGKCAPRYDTELAASNSAAKLLLTALLYTTHTYTMYK
jgi:hypothetical protein